MMALFGWIESILISKMPNWLHQAQIKYMANLRHWRGN